MSELIKGDTEVSNLLIVESENDQYFIEALIEHLNLDVEVGSPICTIDEYECLGGISKLENKLVALKSRVLKEGIEKIGIIFDADNLGVEQRNNEIQEKINLVFGKDTDVIFEIHIMNVNGTGELETVLKKIKSKDSSVADCLEEWQNCLPDEKKLNQKEFDKFWIQIYQRYDTCSKNEKRHAHKNCNNEVSLKEKDIYDYNHDILNDLKEFLQKLGEN
jgi:hypothetical protein